MGQGTEEKTRQSPHVEVQERGEIFFFYRPKVNLESAHSVDDIQRTYVVLRPESGEKNLEEKQSSDSGKEAKFKEQKEVKQDSNPETDRQKTTIGNEETPQLGKRVGDGDATSKKERDEHGPQETKQGDNENAGGHGTEKVDIKKKSLLRLIVMGRKSLPDPSRRGRPYWGYVELVTTDPSDIKKALAAEEYETKTRGHRTKPASRPVGEGVYRLLRHNEGSKMHTHLVYKMELPGPTEHHEPQEAMNLQPEGSYLIQIKNPEHGAPPNAGLQNKRKASFPAHLQGLIGSRRFVSADPPDLLNYEGCEFILIGASDDIEEELGLEVHTEAEGKEECSDLLELFGNIEPEVKAPIVPLIEGEWA